MASRRGFSPWWARVVLLALWGAFFVFNLGVLLLFFAWHWIELDTLKSSLYELNAVYAPYLGAMLLYVWGSWQRAGTGKVSVPFWVAFAGSLLWNLMVVFLLMFVDNIPDAMDTIKDTGALFAWLVAGAIGYYFAQPEGTKKATAAGRGE
ncbi:MAG: hypothetical protein HYV27_08620 [Candidatus Hydrogenedentes bacterium]|nr:hypothetical protein [Candidatus Hydrogenedentota bacterium]